MSSGSDNDAGSAVRSALITGGGSGIGAALAIEVASRGCRVLVSGRRRSALNAVAESSALISVCAGDVTDASHRDELATSLAGLPGPHAVVHAAGHFQAGLLDVLSVDEWRRSFAVNVEARWLLSRRCAELLHEGRVLFIGSDAGASPRAGGAAYSIAQAASETLRRALQAEWADRDISVGAFKPGLVDTDMVRGFMNLTPEEFPALSAYQEYVTNGRVASARDVARFAAWLLLTVPAHRFATTDWDIRDVEHHTEWSDRPLYPESGTGGQRYRPAE
jgi:NAD(P)-dependent dehydrogenase (short-subunit alcohol dehydrogenase family)